MSDPDAVFSLFTTINEGTNRPAFARSIVTTMALLSNTNGELGPTMNLDNETCSVTEGLARLLRQKATEQTAGRAKSRYRIEYRLQAEQEGIELVEDELEAKVEERYMAESLRSYMANISRTMTELEKLEIIERYYRADRRYHYTTHENRGAQREAVYKLTPTARDALTVSPALSQYRSTA